MLIPNDRALNKLLRELQAAFKGSNGSLSSSFASIGLCDSFGFCLMALLAPNVKSTWQVPDPLPGAKDIKSCILVDIEAYNCLVRTAREDMDWVNELLHKHGFDAQSWFPIADSDRQKLAIAAAAILDSKQYPRGETVPVSLPASLVVRLSDECLPDIRSLPVVEGICNDCDHSSDDATICLRKQPYRLYGMLAQTCCNKHALAHKDVAQAFGVDRRSKRLLELGFMPGAIKSIESSLSEVDIDAFLSADVPPIVPYVINGFEVMTPLDGARLQGLTRTVDEIPSVRRDQHQRGSLRSAGNCDVLIPANSTGTLCFVTTTVAALRQSHAVAPDGPSMRKVFLGHPVLSYLLNDKHAPDDTPAYLGFHLARLFTLVVPYIHVTVDPKKPCGSQLLNEIGTVVDAYNYFVKMLIWMTVPASNFSAVTYMEGDILDKRAALESALQGAVASGDDREPPRFVLVRLSRGELGDTPPSSTHIANLAGWSDSGFLNQPLADGQSGDWIIAMMIAQVKDKRSKINHFVCQKMFYGRDGAPEKYQLNDLYPSRHGVGALADKCHLCYFVLVPKNAVLKEQNTVTTDEEQRGFLDKLDQVVKKGHVNSVQWLAYMARVAIGAEGLVGSASISLKDLEHRLWTSKLVKFAKYVSGRRDDHEGFAQEMEKSSKADGKDRYGRLMVKSRGYNIFYLREILIVLKQFSIDITEDVFQCLLSLDTSAFDNAPFIRENLKFHLQQFICCEPGPSVYIDRQFKPVAIFQIPSLSGYPRKDGSEAAFKQNARGLHANTDYPALYESNEGVHFGLSPKPLLASMRRSEVSVDVSSMYAFLLASTANQKADGVCPPLLYLQARIAGDSAFKLILERYSAFSRLFMLMESEVEPLYQIVVLRRTESATIVSATAADQDFHQDVNIQRLLSMLGWPRAISEDLFKPMRRDKVSSVRSQTQFMIDCIGFLLTTVVSRKVSIIKPFQDVLGVERSAHSCQAPSEKQSIFSTSSLHTTVHPQQVQATAPQGIGKRKSKSTVLMTPLPEDQASGQGENREHEDEDEDGDSPGDGVAGDVSIAVASAQAGDQRGKRGSNRKRIKPKRKKSKLVRVAPLPEDQASGQGENREHEDEDEDGDSPGDGVAGDVSIAVASAQAGQNLRQRVGRSDPSAKSGIDENIASMDVMDDEAHGLINPGEVASVGGLAGSLNGSDADDAEVAANTTDIDLSKFQDEGNDACHPALMSAAIPAHSGRQKSILPIAADDRISRQPSYEDASPPPQQIDVSRSLIRGHLDAKVVLDLKEHVLDPLYRSDPCTVQELDENRVKAAFKNDELADMLKGVCEVDGQMSSQKYSLPDIWESVRKAGLGCGSWKAMCAEIVKLANSIWNDPTQLYLHQLDRIGTSTRPDHTILQQMHCDFDVGINDRTLCRADIDENYLIMIIYLRPTTETLVADHFADRIIPGQDPASRYASDLERFSKIEPVVLANIEETRTTRFVNAGTITAFEGTRLHAGVNPSLSQKEITAIIKTNNNSFASSQVYSANRQQCFDEDPSEINSHRDILVCVVSRKRDEPPVKSRTFVHSMLLSPTNVGEPLPFIDPCGLGPQDQYYTLLQFAIHVQKPELRPQVERLLALYAEMFMLANGKAGLEALVARYKRAFGIPDGASASFHWWMSALACLERPLAGDAETRLDCLLGCIETLARDHPQAFRGCMQRRNALQ
eukprot:TRINITY_DN12419_c2_g1_i2.p1 TRINITY_DN12419_c2_g1~~TRINITY_DN12419_c2_g1_i2.p1  ORF type:complete len:1697 (+),score=187.39 TRINITY_DN12419_c2_g1_i2:3-5093(+)